MFGPGAGRGDSDRSARPEVRGRRPRAFAPRLMERWLPAVPLRRTRRFLKEAKAARKLFYTASGRLFNKIFRCGSKRGTILPAGEEEKARKAEKDFPIFLPGIGSDQLHQDIPLEIDPFLSGQEGQIGPQPGAPVPF